jgi:hypothetical protein
MLVRTAAVVCCLLLAASVPSVLAVESASLDQRQSPASDPSMDVRYVVERNPDRIGVVNVTAVVEVPDRVTALSVTPPANATVDSAAGVRRTDGDWEWNGHSETVTVTYTTPVGVTTTFGQRTVDTGGWSLVAKQDVALHSDTTRSAVPSRSARSRNGSPPPRRIRSPWSTPSSPVRFTAR